MKSSHIQLLSYHISYCGDGNNLVSIHTPVHSSVPLRLAQTESGTKAHAHTVGTLWVDQF